MMPQAQATPAPIHDIVGPVSLPGVPLFYWLLLAALLVGLLLWAGLWLWRRQVSRQKTAREIARQQLSALQESAEGLSAYQFGVQVSDVVRKFLTLEFDLKADRQTSVEFLNSVKNNPLFTAEEQSLLQDFLNASDELKYARAEATHEAKTKLLSAASAVIAKDSGPISNPGRRQN